VNVHVVNAPPARIWVTAGNGTVGYANGAVPLTAGKGVASVLPMTNFDDVIAYTYNAAGDTPAVTEWLGTPMSVSAGATATDTVSLDWKRAHYAYLAGPICRHSGKAGTMVKLVLKGWPAGETAEFAGFWTGEGDYWSQHLYTRSQTSGGTGDSYAVRLQVPTKVPVGWYELDTWRADNPDSLVNLWDYFQVCTFKASQSAIDPGAAIRLSGRVPGHGFVTIYSTHHRVTAQPWTLAAKGWQQCGRYRISYGAFHSGLLHPSSTTTYVAKYSGLNFPAFTSIVRVRVR